MIESGLRGSLTLRDSMGSATDADIAIVGAGPAGAAAACRFARAGFGVVLIDQRRFSRDKVCGDFVSPAALWRSSNDSIYRCTRLFAMPTGFAMARCM